MIAAAPAESEQTSASEDIVQACHTDWASIDVAIAHFENSNWRKLNMPVPETIATIMAWALAIDGRPFYDGGQNVHLLPTIVDLQIDKVAGYLRKVDTLNKSSRILFRESDAILLELDKSESSSSIECLVALEAAKPLENAPKDFSENYSITVDNRQYVKVTKVDRIPGAENAPIDTVLKTVATFEETQ